MRLGTVTGVLVVVVVVGATVVLVVVVVGATVVVVEVVVVLDVVVVGSERFRMSCEKPNAAWRPAADPASGEIVEDVGVTSETAAVKLPLGENAANAATANRAMTIHVAKASSRVNLKGRIRLLNMTTHAQHARSQPRP